jgi:hypothetical protein
MIFSFTKDLERKSTSKPVLLYFSDSLLLDKDIDVEKCKK